MDRTYPCREGLGLPNDHNSRRILVLTILMEDVSLNVLLRGFFLISLIMVLACYIQKHSSHEYIKIVTLTIWHDYEHSKINSTNQNELTRSNLGTCMIITTHEIKSNLHLKVFFLGSSFILLSPLYLHQLTLILCNLITYIQKKNLK